MKTFKMRFLTVVLAVCFALIPTAGVFAATTADVVVTATPSFISISVAPGTYDFGAIVESATPSTATNYFTITNGCTIVTDQTIGVTTSDNWTGGQGWAHSATATAGADTVGLKANKGGTWGVSDIIVKRTNDTPNLLADNQSATTNYTFGLKMLAPTSFSDGVQKQVTVRVTAAAAS